MNNRDLPLQILFFAGLILVAVIFYFTRLVDINAGDELGNKPSDPYAGFFSAYQFEQEEMKIQTRLNILKAEYAGDLLIYQKEVQKIENAENISELEKREKFKVLKDIYSKEYFQRKLDLIDQEQLKLEKLRQAKCAKFCVYEDLPGGL